MSFTKSILTTMGIFVVVWGAVVLNANKYPDSRVSGVAASVPPKSDSIRLVGLQEEISLGESGDQVKELWDKFYEANGLHMAVDHETSRLAFAYYEFSEANLSDAIVTIGYNIAGKEPTGYSSAPVISLINYEKIYQNNESWDTTPAWNKIDVGRDPHSVLEEYLMGAGGEVVNTNVYVLYK